MFALTATCNSTPIQLVTDSIHLTNTKIPSMLCETARINSTTQVAAVPRLRKVLITRRNPQSLCCWQAPYRNRGSRQSPNQGNSRVSVLDSKSSRLIPILRGTFVEYTYTLCAEMSLLVLVSISADSYLSNSD